LSPTERDAVPVLPDTDDLIGLWAGLISIDPELGLLIPPRLLVLVGLAVVAAIAEGRIDTEHGVIVFSDRSKSP
jgi:hypothetical protein